MMIIKNVLLAMGLLVLSQLHAQSCPQVEIEQHARSGTPLHEAIYANDVGRVRRLISPSTVNVRDSFGNPPLVYALTPSEMFEPAGIVSTSKRRALILAEGKAREAIASALISGGADVNAAGASGATPLIKLASGGQVPEAEVRLAEQLLKAGANVDARDVFGSTPLLIAAQRHRSALVKLLLSAGADAKITNCRGQAAASLLAQ
jgi:ankyrin repeat protein